MKIVHKEEKSYLITDEEETPTKVYKTEILHIYTTNEDKIVAYGLHWPDIVEENILTMIENMETTLNEDNIQFTEEITLETSNTQQLIQEYTELE